MSSLKILVCGDVEGHFKTLFAKVGTLHQKKGPFEYLLCVGNFFGTNDDEWKDVKTGKTAVPITTYILGPNRREHLRFYPEDSSEIAPNVIYLVELCIPENLLRVRLRNSVVKKEEDKNSCGDKLLQLLLFLRVEVEGEERISLAKSGFKSNEAMNRNKKDRDIGTSVPMANDLELQNTGIQLTDIGKSSLPTELLIGVENLLQKLDWSVIERETSVQSIKWKFIPPTAPWWGGSWERMVQMIKKLLRRVLGKACLYYEELASILCDCETVINSRPLTYLSEDPNDLIPHQCLFEIFPWWKFQIWINLTIPMLKSVGQGA
ncbi:CWF19-like protein 1 [Araneus ventricosus]|uniref:CWF19-like protein 1 n=1 Tax=Araneus ventricosus TaxID=182803 RepID=A0A4Y2NP60_ARAVE|nr:CWF19-like protein 1 [Araneus ventricosus]GBN41081.1 CWF19-like protein 1 [Araneus ventricosus]